MRQLQNRSSAFNLSVSCRDLTVAAIGTREAPETLLGRTLGRRQTPVRLRAWDSHPRPAPPGEWRLPVPRLRVQICGGCLQPPHTGCRFLSGTVSSCLQAHKEGLIRASAFSLTPLGGEGLEFPPRRLPQTCLCFSISSPSPGMCNCFGFTTLGIRGKGPSWKPRLPSLTATIFRSKVRPSIRGCYRVFSYFLKNRGKMHIIQNLAFFSFLSVWFNGIKGHSQVFKILIYLFGCAGS